MWHITLCVLSGTRSVTCKVALQARPASPARLNA